MSLSIAQNLAIFFANILYTIIGGLIQGNQSKCLLKSNILYLIFQVKGEIGQLAANNACAVWRILRISCRRRKRRGTRWRRVIWECRLKFLNLSFILIQLPTYPFPKMPSHLVCCLWPAELSQPKSRYTNFGNDFDSQLAHHRSQLEDCMVRLKTDNGWNEKKLLISTMLAMEILKLILLCRANVAVAADCRRRTHAGPAACQLLNALLDAKTPSWRPVSMLVVIDLSFSTLDVHLAGPQSCTALTAKQLFAPGNCPKLAL
ncbi:unnamed protein product [Nesidiocoris tenuis]|uniref:Uncharacterized protein n=1 Tax=Nesidiocoris tenuis TaxID=355587 RepID=A0A6H5GUD0_9HEMI|nr:unnamed protein product [Nesidiocoris tenuis]